MAVPEMKPIWEAEVIRSDLFPPPRLLHRVLVCGGGDGSRRRVRDALAKRGSPQTGADWADFTHLTGPSTCCRAEETQDVFKACPPPLAFAGA